ncbi:hypothetical protein WJX74_007751 [Apatococcus lobatus]|uniref:START domain-containing protein n=1 Tax=Apatococcus lobatus TaxID=904363 RepID=A0AAW1Q990_9CHLO
MKLGEVGLPTFLGDLDVNFILSAVLPVWVFGAIIGLLIPRPKWLDQTARSGALLLSTPPGTFLRGLALLFHGAVIVREIWFCFTTPGTFHALIKGSWSWLKGQGFRLPPHLIQQREEIVKRKGKPARKRHNSAHASSSASGTQGWYVTESDLAYLKERIEDDKSPPGSGDWEPMMDKDLGRCTYTAWRQCLPGNTTEYKSVTVASDSTAEEFMDFYLDDTWRPKWDTMISHHEVVENGPGDDRCQVVRWIRSFPFSFIKKREYIIARRVFRDEQKGCLYGITKAIEHPRAAHAEGIIRMDTFHSMWRSRTIPDPNGSDRPACETVLLHFEQFKIPEKLARFAVKHGMSGFVKTLAVNIGDFVESRRKRVKPFDRDPDGFGVNTTPDPPLRRTSSSASDNSTVSLAGTSTAASSRSMSDSDSCASSSHSRVPRRRHKRQARKDAGPMGTIKVAAFTLCAAGLVAAVAQRSGVLPQGSAAKPDQQQQHQQQRRDRKYHKHSHYAVPHNHVESLHTVQEEEE